MTESSKIFQQRQEKKWIERCRIGKSVLYQKGNERKVVHPDREDLHFTAPDKPLTHETIYQAPADEIHPDNGRKTNGKDHKGNWGKHE